MESSRKDDSGRERKWKWKGKRAAVREGERAELPVEIVHAILAAVPLDAYERLTDVYCQDDPPSDPRPTAFELNNELRTFCSLRSVSKGFQQHVELLHPRMIEALAADYIERAGESETPSEWREHFATFGPLRRARRLCVTVWEPGHTPTYNALLSLCDDLEYLLIRVVRKGKLDASQLVLRNPHLSTLRIDHCMVTHRHHEPHHDLGGALMVDCLPRLASVIVKTNVIRDHLRKMPLWGLRGFPGQLEELYLRCLRLHWGEVHVGLRRFAGLRKLQLDNMNMEGSHLRVLDLPRLPLQILVLGHNRLENDDIRSLGLGKNTTLKTLSLRSNLIYDPTCLKLDANRSIEVLNLAFNNLESLVFNIGANTSLRSLAISLDTLDIGDDDDDLDDDDQFAPSQYLHFSSELRENTSLRLLSIVGLGEEARPSDSFSLAGTNNIEALHFFTGNFGVCVAPANLVALGVLDSQALKTIFMEELDHFDVPGEISYGRMVDMELLRQGDVFTELADVSVPCGPPALDTSLVR